MLRALSPGRRVEYARIYGMNLKFARIPVEYPAAKLSARGNAGFVQLRGRLRSQRKLWTTPEQALARTEHTMAPGTCPGEPAGAE